jgi:cytoskeletal protein CcmA (bactofilin family)
LKFKLQWGIEVKIESNSVGLASSFQTLNLKIMKLVNFVAFLAICIMFNAASAQDIRKGGSSVGKVESNGDVRIGGSVKGRFESNGDIRVGGSVKGKIESNGDIRKGGSVVGKVESNGDVRIGGSVKGRIESNGDVRKGGSVVGSAKGVKKEQAAVLFFFDFFEI